MPQPLQIIFDEEQQITGADSGSGFGSSCLFSHLLIDLVDIYRKTSSRDPATGGPVFTWDQLVEGQPCAVQVSSWREAQEQMRETGSRVFDVFFPYGTDIRTTDRLQPSTGIAAGTLLDVTSPPSDESGRRTYHRISATEANGGAD